jgi:hypothetical protein
MSCGGSPRLVWSCPFTWTRSWNRSTADGRFSTAPGQKHLHVQNKRGIGKGMSEAPEVLIVNGPAIDDKPAESPDLFG